MLSYGCPSIDWDPMLYLLLSIVAMLVGVGLASLIRHKKVLTLVSVAVSISITLLIVFHIVPDLRALGGPSVYYIFAIGFVIMFLFELYAFIPKVRLSQAASFIAILGLAIHTAFDGFALFQMAHLPHIASTHSHSHGDEMIWLFIFHRIPVGMFIWFQFYKETGIRWVVKILGIFCFTTIAGYYLGQAYSTEVLEHIGMTQFQAFSCGVLAHIVFEPIQIMIQNKLNKTN